MQSIFYDIVSLIKCIFSRPDVVLVLGVSGCIFLPFFKLFSRARVITNIDGLEWKRDKWGSLPRKFLKISEKMAVKFSDVVVTDNKAISDYVLYEYGINSETIAYGGDHAIIGGQHHQNLSVQEYALALCRIEPENNVAMILDAFSKSNKVLKFIGNWEHSEFSRKLREKYSTSKNIQLIDPIYDLDTLFNLRKSSSIYIHGHSAGGTNPSLVEMMHFGKPILAFDCDFNRYTTDNSAIYFKSSSELIDIIDSEHYTRFEKVGNKMVEVANRCYKWQNVTEQYEKLY